MHISLSFFETETINTFINSRSSLENHNRFKIIMGKVYTRFQTKTAQKTLPNGAVHTYIACIREYPPGEGVSLTRKQPTFRYATAGLAAK